MAILEYIQSTQIQDDDFCNHFDKHQVSEETYRGMKSSWRKKFGHSWPGSSSWFTNLRDHCISADLSPAQKCGCTSLWIAFAPTLPQLLGQGPFQALVGPQLKVTHVRTTCGLLLNGPISFAYCGPRGGLISYQLGNAAKQQHSVFFGYVAKFSTFERGSLSQNPFSVFCWVARLWFEFRMFFYGLMRDVDRQYR